MFYSKQQIQALEQKVMALEGEVRLWKTRAERDTLTGCLRRDAFMDLIEKQKQFGHLPQTVTLAMIDADFFKKVNDTHGHLAGDKVLEFLGKAISTKLPTGSIVCRMGGEEFVALIPSASGEALEALEQLRQAIAHTQIAIDLKQKISVTVSMGISEWNTDKSFLEATGRADMALYQAKNSGRNKIAA